MADRIIPIDFTTTIRAFATYILRNKCDQPATQEQVTAYEKELAAKGFVNPLDVLVRDNRYWPILRQYLTKVVVIDDASLPACSLVPQPVEVKPQPIVVLSPATSSSASAEPAPTPPAASSTTVKTAPTKKAPGCRAPQVLVNGKCITL